MPFLPARRACSSEKLGAEADDVFVNGKALFLGADKYGDDSVVVAASKLLVRHNTSSIELNTNRGRLRGRCTVSFSFSFSRERFAGDATSAMVSIDLGRMVCSAGVVAAGSGGDVVEGGRPKTCYNHLVPW